MGKDDEKPSFEEFYADRRKRLIQRRHTYSKLLQRHLATYSAGAFGISIAISKLGITEGVIHGQFFLFFAWFAFGISTILSVLSHFFAKRRYDQELEHWDKFYKTGQRDAPPSDKPIEWIIRISVVAFVLGCISLPIYAGLNIAALEDSSTETKIQKQRRHRDMSNNDKESGEKKSKHTNENSKTDKSKSDENSTLEFAETPVDARPGVKHPKASAKDDQSETKQTEGSQKARGENQSGDDTSKGEKSDKDRESAD